MSAVTHYEGWLFNQHVTLWQGLAICQRQTRELILGPNLAAETLLLSFDRMQSRVTTDL
jgi:hypothetical protein